MSFKKVICALDTSNLNSALDAVYQTRDLVGAYKIGHALTLAHGLDVIPRLQDAGATRIFLDLKFHDIPNSVAIAVKEAARREVWMMTVHISGGLHMLQAAMEEAAKINPSPAIVGVAVLTSLDDAMLQNYLGIPRTVEEQFEVLGQLAVEANLDGMICSPMEVKSLRKLLGPNKLIVTPGIRAVGANLHDQKRTSDAKTVLEDGADYLVIGRAISEHPNPREALESLGIS